MNFVDLNHSLQIRAAAAYAVSLWEKPDVKKLIIEACDGVWTTEGKTSNVAEKIVKEIFCTNLPESLCLYVVHVVKSMATNLRSWLNFLYSKYDFKINIADAIQWTSTGTIDQVKVFEKWLLNHTMKAPHSRGTYYMAYHCFHVKFLFQHSKHIQELSRLRFWDPSGTFASVLSMTLYIQKKSFSGGPEMVSKELEREISDLFCSAVQQGCILVTKFCWNKMTEANREKYCTSMGDVCVELYKINRYEDYLQQQYVKIMIFLMSRMSADQVKKFLDSKKCKILPMVISVWPEINFFLHLFEIVKEKLSISEFATILLHIISHFDQKDDFQRNDFKFNYSECFYFELFKKAYYSFCKNIKKSSPDNFSTGLADVIKKLFEILHVPGLRLILESRFFKDCNYSSNVVREIILERIFNTTEFSVMDLLLREIFNANNDLEKFKLVLKFFDYLINKKEYRVANMFLILLNVQRVELWGEKREALGKSEINLVDLFKTLIFDDQFDVAVNLLNWVLETEEEKENFKIIFSKLFSDFVKKKIYSCWAKSSRFNEKKDGEHHISNFLKILFKSEIEMNLFKREKLIENGKCVVMFLAQYHFSFTVAKSLQNLNEFIKFCEITDDKIAEIKKDLRENLINIKANLINILNQKNGFFVIHCLINWCTENDEQKKGTIKSLMMSVDIISVWEKIDESNIEMITFCNEWIKESEDILRLKDEILKRKKNSYDYQEWENVFAKLMRGDKINIYDIDPSYGQDFDYPSYREEYSDYSD